MAKDLPFDEDVMTLFMGLGGPDKPGQHGRTITEAPSQDAIDLVIQIRDMCEDFLKKAGKDSDEDKQEKDDNMDTDMNADEMEEE